MNSVITNLFKGVAVVIDNAVETEVEIGKILADIQAGGGHAITLKELPSNDYDLEHFSRVSFFIMDWNLKDHLAAVADLDVEPGAVRMPRRLGDDDVAENVAFLKRLSRNRHAPVFIFTNEDPQTVRDALAGDGELHAKVEESHILVMSKTDVGGRLYQVLDDWAKSTPSVLTLKTWEWAFVRAANDLFIDLHDKTPNWPVIFWQTFEKDGVPPSIEMNRLLNRLVEARMDPLPLNLDQFADTIGPQGGEDITSYRATVHRVLEGERFLRAERLDPTIHAPGDVFEFPVDDSAPSYYVNIRPECDCLRGGPGMQLYLLQAKRLESVESLIDRERGNFKVEKDAESIVHAMIDGATFSIRFKDMKIRTIKQMGTENYRRVGRLLPPFITRVQQRYAAYVQRPGMPRIPPALYEDVPGESQPGVEGAATTA